MIELVHPSAHSSPQRKRQMDRFSRFCTAYRTESAYTLQWAPLSTKIALPMGDPDLPCNTWCFRPMRVHNPIGTSIGSVVFAQMTAVCLYFTMVCLFPPSKLPLPMLASGPHVIHGSLGPPESGTQMAIWSFQPFLQGSLVWQTDVRATDRPQTTLLGAMRRNNA